MYLHFSIRRGEAELCVLKPTSHVNCSALLFPMIQRQSTTSYIFFQKMVKKVGDVPLGVIHKLRNAAGVGGWCAKCYESVSIGRWVVYEMLRNAKRF